MKGFHRGFFVSITLIATGAALIFLEGAYLKFRIGSLPFNYASIGIATWAIWNQANRTFLNRLSVFVLWLGILLAYSTYARHAGISFWIFAGYWFVIWLTLALGINLLLPHLGIRFGLILDPKAFERPTSEPDRTFWMWKETAYVGAVMRPVGELLMFGITAAITWYYRVDVLPRGWIGLDATSLMPAALLFPVASLTMWVISWSRETQSAYIIRPMPILAEGRVLVLSILVFYVVGLLQQPSYDTKHVATWTICVAILMMFLAIIWKLSSRLQDGETRSPQPLELLRLKPKVDVLRILFMLVFLYVYHGLLAIALLRTIPIGPR